MREEFRSDTLSDFSKRYEGTFGWYEKESGDKVLVKLEAVREYCLTFIDELGMLYEALPDVGNTFEFLPVERGVYNTSKGVVFLQRIPNRMWKRGLCSENTSFQLLKEGGVFAIEGSFLIIEECFKQEQFTPPVDSSSTHSYEGAWDRMFSLVGVTLFLYNRIIGSLNGNVLTLNSPLFKQELQDLVRQKNLPFTLEIYK